MLLLFQKDKKENDFMKKRISYVLVLAMLLSVLLLTGCGKTEKTELLTEEPSAMTEDAFLFRLRRER